jgi:hypothetical protein
MVPWLRDQESLAILLLELFAVVRTVVDEERARRGGDVLARRDRVLTVHVAWHLKMNPFQLASQAVGIFGRTGHDEHFILTDLLDTGLQEPLALW